MRIKVLLCGLLLLVGISCKNSAKVVFTDPVGVWANADCELLRTEKFALFFERDGERITSTLHLMDMGDTILMGKCVFGKDSVLLQYAWNRGDMQQPADVGSVRKDGRLRVSINGREQLLEKIEDISIVEPYEMLKPSLLEIGSCVQQWSLGTKFGRGNGSVYFEGGTNRHNYTFNISSDMAYCRAARMRFNDRGGLFAQNIRLMSNANEYTCEMPQDNLVASKAHLIIDDSKFNPDVCVYDADGIYWSFVRFDGDTAELNGCGEIYRYARPQSNENNHIEWIAFDKY